MSAAVGILWWRFSLNWYGMGFQNHELQKTHPILWSSRANTHRSWINDRLAKLVRVARGVWAPLQIGLHYEKIIALSFNYPPDPLIPLDHGFTDLR